MSKTGAGRVVVIGAGMGGLAAAVDLASRGAEVLLLERAGHPGGKVRRETVGGASMDAGPTVFTLRSVFEALFADAGADFAERVPHRRLDRLARHGWADGSRLDLYHETDRSAEAIGALAGPAAARAYLAFARDARRVFELLDETFMRAQNRGVVALSARLGLGGLAGLLTANPFRSLWGELGRRFTDPRLRQLFARYATYCGSSPFQSPATLMLIAHAERAGVWAIDGGMARLAHALAELAEAQGARLEYGVEVRDIRTGPGGVEGVRRMDGRFEPADAVVFNGDCQALERGLLGQGVARALPARGAEPRSLSALTWCLRGRAEGFPLDYHTVLFGRDYPAEFSRIFRDGAIVSEPTVYLCAPDRARGEEPDDAERLFLLVNAPPRDLDADTLARARARTFDWLEHLGLHIAPSGEPVLTGPAEFAARFPGSDGALYGWPTHGWRGSFRRPGTRTAVPGLYLAGGTVHPGPGVPMAALSGRLAAEGVRRRLAGAD